MSDPKLYDVVIAEIRTSKIVAIIGTRLTLEKAEKRIETGLMKTNTEVYFVAEVKAGSRKVGDKK